MEIGLPLDRYPYAVSPNSPKNYDYPAMAILSKVSTSFQRAEVDLLI